MTGPARPGEVRNTGVWKLITVLLLCVESSRVRAGRNAILLARDSEVLLDRVGADSEVACDLFRGFEGKDSAQAFLLARTEARLRFV